MSYRPLHSPSLQNSLISLLVYRNNTSTVVVLIQDAILHTYLASLELAVPRAATVAVVLVLAAGLLLLLLLVLESLKNCMSES